VSPGGDDVSPAHPLEERWTVGTDDAELLLDDDHLHARIDCARGELVARVSAVGMGSSRLHRF